MLRSTHALEIPFVFDTLHQRGADKFTGNGPERAAIAAAMHEAWIAFARTGDPGWSAFEVPERATMRFGGTGAAGPAGLESVVSMPEMLTCSPGLSKRGLPAVGSGAL